MGSYGRDLTPEDQCPYKRYQSVTPWVLPLSHPPLPVYTWHQEVVWARGEMVTTHKPRESSEWNLRCSTLMWDF